GEVLATHIRKGVMDGELYRADANPLLYMGTKYNAEGKSQGKYYAHLNGIGPATYDSPLLKQYLSQPRKRTRKECLLVMIVKTALLLAVFVTTLCISPKLSNGAAAPLPKS